LLATASLDSSLPLTVLAASSPHCIVLKAVEAVDKCIEAILLPWVVAAVCPLERCVLRIHEHLYASSSVSQGESEWITTLESCSTGLASNQLLLLPQGNVADAVRGMICSRILRLFNRHACLVRPLDDAGRMRLARDCAQLEVAVSPIWPSQLQRLGPSYLALRALRPFIFATSTEIQDAFTSDSTSQPNILDSSVSVSSGQSDKTVIARQQLQQNLALLRPCDILHHIISRLPRECVMPHTRNKMEISTYSEALDMAAIATTVSNSTSSSSGLTNDTLAQARARLVPSQRALLDIDVFVAKSVSACVDIDFVARAAVTGGPSASSYTEVTISRDLCTNILSRGIRHNI